ncbi:MAG TPA: hypothetical protein VGO68_05320 [Pyrinomonadaceae bacterium]|jgi:hypothetical protein|nr:hypothetical protein [Pyrinomonadaceae bacterium]
METDQQTRTGQIDDHSRTTGSSRIDRSQSNAARRARRKFLRFFPKGFRDQTYLDWERGYKWKAHEQWNHDLERSLFRKLLRDRDFQEIAGHAVRIESRTNLLFSFEKMALRDAVKSKDAAQMFSEGLYDFLYGSASASTRFSRWCDVVSKLPRKQTRVLTWPIVTVFGFIAEPKTHIFLKPNVTKAAAREYGFDFQYESRPSWETYASLLEFAKTVGQDLKNLRPKDLIDIQSFIWVQGSDEYEE